MRISVDELRPHLTGEVTRATLVAAVSAAQDRLLLDEEAKTHLSPEDARASDAAERLLASLFNPRELCTSIRESTRRAHYEANLWRFQMPSAYRVSAIDWVCCSGKACEHPGALPCRESGRRFMETLKQELPDEIDDEGFGQAFNERRPHTPRLRFRRVTLFYDKGVAIPRRLRRPSPEESLSLTKLKVGHMGDPIETREGLTLMRLRRKEAPKRLSWDDPRTQAILRTELCPSVWHKAREQYLRDLRRQMPISVDYEAIKAKWGVNLRQAPPR